MGHGIEPGRLGRDRVETLCRKALLTVEAEVDYDFLGHWKTTPPQGTTAAALSHTIRKALKIGGK